MKHVGEAVKEQEMTFGSEDKVNVIGIATWGIVDRKDSLIAPRVWITNNNILQWNFDKGLGQLVHYIKGLLYRKSCYSKLVEKQPKCLLYCMVWYA